MKAAHLHCSKICLLSAQQVRKCENRECSLWGFRDGHNPNRRKTTTIERNASSGEYMTLNKAGKSKPVDISKKILTLDGKDYELMPVIKQKDSK
jgi:hypothetical protein